MTVVIQEEDLEVWDVADRIMAVMATGDQTGVIVPDRRIAGEIVVLFPVVVMRPDITVGLTRRDKTMVIVMSAE